MSKYDTSKSEGLSERGNDEVADFCPSSACFGLVAGRSGVRVHGRPDAQSTRYILGLVDGCGVSANSKADDGKAALETGGLQQMGLAHEDGYL